MTDPEILYLIFSTLLTFCLIYPPKEFEGVGLTIPQLFHKFLVPKSEDFVYHHIIRTTITAVVLPFLPTFFALLGYVQFEVKQEATTIPWSTAAVYSLILPTLSGTTALSWYLSKWQMHPIVRLLRSHESNWQELAGSVNEEYRNQEKFEIKLNMVSDLIMTENWIIKTLPLSLNLAHQGQVEMIADRSDVHAVNEFGRDAVQYLTVNVINTTNPARKPFTFRLKTTDYTEIQERFIRRIILAPTIRLHPSLIEKFVIAFEELIRDNPKFRYNMAQIEDPCFACTTARPNVKIRKNCGDIDEFGEELPDDEKCGNCACRPMWCARCLGRWFAARQEADEPDTWLMSKSTCPMCRTKFCVLDVCCIDDL